MQRSSMAAATGASTPPTSVAPTSDRAPEARARERSARAQSSLMARHNPVEPVRSAGGWERPVVWKQFVDAIGRMGLEAHQHVCQILHRIDADRLATGHQRVEHGEVVACALVADKEEILSVMWSST